MTGRLFGTDGIRGIANCEITCHLAYNVGQAVACYLQKRHHTPKVAIGKDTRISGDMLESALISGLTSAGANVLKLGVIPTPAVSLLTNIYQCDAGMMVSASHNPVEYNGIKLFDENGIKFPDEIEDKIESLIKNSTEIPLATGEQIGKILPSPNAKEDYITWLLGIVSQNLDGIKVALDCANGATSQIAEEVFTRLGAEVFVTSNQPNGININKNCGSTYLETISRFTKEVDATIGIAFDGDGDRALFCDEYGQEVDGDQALAIFAHHQKQQNALAQNTLVATVMSNLGLTLFAKEQGITVVSTKVGDRYVWEELKKGGYSLGGEQSGHIIFPHHAVTGDGILTALKMAEILLEKKETLSNLAKLMVKLPQVLYNVKTTEDAKKKIPTDATLLKLLEDTKKSLGERGRILLRPSGTEPLYRVMLEGENHTAISELGEKIVSYLKKEYSVS